MYSEIAAGSNKEGKSIYLLSCSSCYERESERELLGREFQGPFSHLWP